MPMLTDYARVPMYEDFLCFGVWVDAGALLVGRAAGPSAEQERVAYLPQGDPSKATLLSQAGSLIPRAVTGSVVPVGGFNSGRVSLVAAIGQDPVGEWGTDAPLLSGLVQVPGSTLVVTWRELPELPPSTQFRARMNQDLVRWVEEEGRAGIQVWDPAGPFLSRSIPVGASPKDNALGPSCGPSGIVPAMGDRPWYSLDLDVASDGSCLVWGERGCAERSFLLDLTHGSEPRTLSRSGEVRAIRLTKSGNWIAASAVDSEIVRVWNSKNGGDPQVHNFDGSCCLARGFDPESILIGDRTGLHHLNAATGTRETLWKRDRVRILEIREGWRDGDQLLRCSEENPEGPPSQAIWLVR